MQYYREKIKAEAEGRSYVAPPPSKTINVKAGGMTRNSRSFGNSGWDDWGDEGGRPTKVILVAKVFLCKNGLCPLILDCKCLQHSDS